MKPPNDDELGRLLSLVVGVLVLCIVYLVLLLPFAGQAGVIVGAITALTTLVGTIIGVKAWRRKDR